MSNKDYRELQISSSQLVIIFLAIIVLGVVIFILGISVGKKQSQIVLASQTETESGTEMVTQEQAVPLDKPEEKKAELSSPAKKEPTPQKQAEKTQPQALEWFIQVGAFQNSQSAKSVADRFKEDGYNAIVLSPSSSTSSRLYKVRIGGYATKELAENAQAEMVRKDPKAAEYLIIQQR
jgi:cell division septation protein DedD